MRVQKYAKNNTTCVKNNTACVKNNTACAKNNFNAEPSIVKTKLLLHIDVVSNTLSLEGPGIGQKVKLALG